MELRPRKKVDYVGPDACEFDSDVEGAIYHEGLELLKYYDLNNCVILLVIIWLGLAYVHSLNSGVVNIM